MARHLLDAKKVEKAKPKVKPYRLADGDRLYLYVAPSGVKAWQYRYRHEGKQQTLTLGKLSDVLTLAEVRKRTQQARDKAAAGEHLTRESVCAEPQVRRRLEHVRVDREALDEARDKTQQLDAGLSVGGLREPRQPSFGHEWYPDRRGLRPPRGADAEKS